MDMSREKKNHSFNDSISLMSLVIHSLNTEYRLHCVNKWPNNKMKLMIFTIDIDRRCI